MSDLSDFSEDQLATWLLTDGSVTRPTEWWVALYTVAPTDAGGGTEVSTGGYARAAVTFTAPSGGATANDAEITIPASGADWTVVAVGIFDASTGGNLLAWKAVTSQTVTSGRSARFAAGALVVEFR